MPVLIVVAAMIAATGAIAALSVHLARQRRRADVAERELVRLRFLMERLPVRIHDSDGDPYHTSAWTSVVGEADPVSDGRNAARSDNPAETIRDYVIGGRNIRIKDCLVRLPDSRTAAIAIASDVTELISSVASVRTNATSQQAEAERARNRADRAVGLLNALPVPVWERDRSGIIRWGNLAYQRAVDADEATVARNGPELARGLDLHRRSLETGREATTDRHVIMGGERLFMRIAEAPVSSSPAGGAGFSPAGGAGFSPAGGSGARAGQTEPDAGCATVGYALDQTALDEARADLGRHIAAHGDVLEHLKSAIAIFGTDRRLKFYNQAYTGLWGLDEEWLNTGPTLGEVLEYLRERRRFPEFADFQSYKRSQVELFTSVLQRQEDMLHLPDGRTLRQFITPHPFGGLLFVLEDVTSTLALERSYNTLLQVQNETLDNLEEGVAVFGSDGRLRLSNPAFLTIWGLRGEDVAGSPHLAELVGTMKARFSHEADWEARRSDLLSLGLEREAGTRRLRRDDGSVVSMSAVPLPDGGKLVSTLDVTDSDRVEQALRASNEALETADRLKSEFIANVSYQLRTPLNAILGFAEILNNRYFGELNDRQSDYTGSIIDASNRLLQLIDDILDLATIEAGYMSLERHSIDIREMLGKVYDLTREWAGKQGLKVEMECPDDIGSIDADDRRLRQALYNLISNAIKFTPPGGRITLWTRREADVIRFGVTDTGVGIPEADQRRVFGRFEKGERHVRNGGIGLGLALVKSFVEMHGGRLELLSQPGEGTTISCLLPASPASVIAPFAPPPCSHGQASVTAGDPLPAPDPAGPRSLRE